MKLVLSPSTLRGRIGISGAKNSALRLLAASLLTKEAIVLENYPADLLDARVHVAMLQQLGKQCRESSDTISISETCRLTSELAWSERSIRNTLLILGALTARLGSGAVPVPGGCQLGDRKYDLHVQVLETLGAKVTDTGDGWLKAEAPAGLAGRDVVLPLRSTGATENAILCGCLAKGVTRVWNPHIRPEILDLITFLTKLGAKITVRGQESIRIEGVPVLTGGKHRIISDSVEALTWLIGAVITGGEVEMDHFPYTDLEVPLIYLRESGVRAFRCGDSLLVRGGACYPIEISTGPYPGINSDMQPLFAVFGARAQGVTKIIDLRFPGRYGYAHELAKMGLVFSVEDNILKIQGGKPLHGAEVKALDLRAGAALLLAGLTAEGETTIRDAWQIHRGYHQLERKLSSLGAQVRFLE